MIEQIQYFQKGTVYRIRNRKTKKDLCLCSKLELKTSLPQQTPDQLWVLNQIKNNEYEVLQVKSGTVLTQKEKKRSFDTKIAKRKMTDNQLWNIIFAQNYGDINYFWIKPTQREQLSFCASSLDDNVRVTSIDQTLSICLWEFIPYRTTNQLLARLSFLKSPSSNLFLEVPEYDSEQGANIIQYLYTGGGNQRWIIEPYEVNQQITRQYTIKNYSSNLSLTAIFTKGSFKVIQSVFNCSPDQRWFLLPIKDNTYSVQSVSNRQYYLGITNDRGGSPVTLIQDRLKSHWIIEGHIPSP